MGTEQAFDWAVREADLFVDGLKREPESGWEIRWRPEGREEVRTYTLFPVTGERCFDVMDQLGVMYRLHTKLTGIEAA